MRLSSTCLLTILGVLCLSPKPAYADDGGVQTAKLLPGDGAADDLFGILVAISNGTAIVGARTDDDNGIDSGSAYLFDTLTGMQIAKLLPNDGATGDLFGVSVAISGSTAIVGADGDDDNGSSSGSAYLFDTLTGVQITKLLPSDGAANDIFGRSVAISGTTAIVGARLDDDNGIGSGSAYLFDTVTGNQIAKLLPSDGALGDFFGHPVAISGTTAIVGAINDDDNGSSSGSAYLFDTLTGVQIAKLLPGDGAAGDFFGQSVAISGSTAIVGTPGDADNGSHSGSAYLFDTLTGVQFAKLVPGDGAANDSFGLSVAISGSTAIVGAALDDDNGSDSGSAYLYETLILASATTRNGSGLNASILTRLSNPVLGSNFLIDLDCTGHSPSFAILQLYMGASSGSFLPGGELLIDMASPLLVSITQVHTGGVVPFSIAVPNDPAFCGTAASAQGVVFGAPFYELSNALDIVLGL